MAEILDIGNLCTHCFNDTSFGSGRFVNRIPSGTDKYDGYMCYECQWYPEIDDTDCSVCFIEINEDETKWSEEGDPYCEKCYENDMGNNSTTSHNFNPE